MNILVSLEYLDTINLPSCMIDFNRMFGILFKLILDKHTVQISKKYSMLNWK